MARKSNQPKGFWHELKRRKVFNVISVYAGAAFIILQVVALVKDPLRLPMWTSALVIVVLCIGFIIAAIVGWIYEITPSGMKVTKPENARKHSDSATTTHSPFTLTPSETSKGWKLATYTSLVVIVVLAGWHFYPQIFPQDPIERLQSAGEKLTVVVMPFQNMTGDTSLNFYQLAIQSNLSGNLSNYPEDLTVRQDELINSMIEENSKVNLSSLTPSFAAGFSQKIEANVFIYGNFQKSGNKMVLNARLVDSETSEILKSILMENYDNDIIHVCDSLSRVINNFLVVNKLIKERPWIKTSSYTLSSEALKNYLKGLDLRRKGEWRNDNYKNALKFQQKALEFDPDFINPKNEIATIYVSMGEHEKAKKWFKSYYPGKVKYPLLQQISLDFKYSELYGTPFDVIEVLLERYNLDDQDPATSWNLGSRYNSLFQYENAIPYLEQAIELCRKLEIKPLSAYYYINLGIAYHETGQYGKEKRLYKKGEKDFPDNRFLIVRQVILAMKMGNKKEADRYLEKYKSIYRGLSSSEADLLNSIAIRIYQEADDSENAEKCFRRAVELEPEKKSIIYYFAYFLIDKEQNVAEGIALTEKLLESDPENYTYLHSKGWGLYKQAKYKEALKILQKSWDLRMEKSIYWHKAWLHLEAARKAVAEMK